MKGACHDKCHPAVEAENAGTNESLNATMGEIIAARYNRREILRGALAVSAISATVSPLALATADQAKAAENASPSLRSQR